MSITKGSIVLSSDDLVLLNTDERKAAKTKSNVGKFVCQWTIPSLKFTERVSRTTQNEYIAASLPSDCIVEIELPDGTQINKRAVLVLGDQTGEKHNVKVNANIIANEKGELVVNCELA